MNQFGQIINALQELRDDEVPKYIADKLDEAIAILQGDEEAHLLSNRAVSLLEEVSENSSLQSYERSALFNIISRLESI